MVVAVKSLPPRPKVVTAPDFQPFPRNPVTTGIAGSCIQSP
uniref:Uncharacterized protein n=1 Tax=Zea mays TaxID=4577 RepID=C0PIB7_MAIZE|nr:unknown [Zea mays]